MHDAGDGFDTSTRPAAPPADAHQDSAMTARMVRKKLSSAAQAHLQVSAVDSQAAASEKARPQARAKPVKSRLPRMETSWLERRTFILADEWGRNLEALGIPAYGLSLLTLAQDFAYGASEEVKPDCILIRRDRKVKILPLVSDWETYDRTLMREAAALPHDSALGYVPEGRIAGWANRPDLVEHHREYVYHRETVAEMVGSSFSQYRREIRMLLKAGAHVEPIGPSNLDRVLACNDRWFAGKHARGRKTYYRGRTLWTFENLPLLEQLGVRHLALLLDNDVVGYAVCSHIGASTMIFTFRRGDREVRGAMPFLVSEMAKLFPGQQWINDGPAVRKPGLAWVKERLTANAGERQMKLGWLTHGASLHPVSTAEIGGPENAEERNKMNNAHDGFEPSIAPLPGRASQPLETRTDNDPALPVSWRGSSILRGCNIYHERTVLRVDLDLGVLHGKTSGGGGPEFADRFIARFHDVAHIPPTAAPNQAFFDALRSDRGAPFDEVLLEAILAIERKLAHTSHDFVPIGFARIENIASPAQPRRTRLVWESRSPVLSRAAARLALASLLELLAGLFDPGCPESPSGFDTELAELLRRAGRRQVSTTVSVIALAAHARGIPCESIGGPHLQLGHGARQRIVYSSAPAEISLGAAQLSRNKRRTAQRLRQMGLPATRQSAAGSASEAVAAAASLGYPVVVKPQKGKQGGGVSVGIAREADMAAAFERARADGSGVLVEEFVRGRTYRLLVIGGRFAAALEIAVPSVRGDGSSRIGDLIEALNRDPMRNGIRLFEVEVDDDLRDCLARGGYTLNDIPPAGVEIALRTAANVAIGGVHHEVSDLVHASHRDLAERAAAAIGLTVAGIDVVSADISLPCSEAGTRIIEVNARPGLCMHTFPRHGQGRDVAGALLEQTFPAGATGRVRTALIIGRRGAGTTARELDALWRANGIVAGLVTHKHAAIGGQAISQNALPPHEALALIHRDARLEALAVASSPRRAVARGLALDSADAVAVLKPETRIDIEIHAQIVDLARRAARGVIVVDADDQAALKLLEAERSRLILIGASLNHPAIDNHLALGGTAVLVAPDDSSATVLRGGQTLEVLHRAQAQPPASPGGRIARAQWLVAVLYWALPA